VFDLGTKLNVMVWFQSRGTGWLHPRVWFELKNKMNWFHSYVWLESEMGQILGIEYVSIRESCKIREVVGDHGVTLA
jgi:hypothetical protein